MVPDPEARLALSAAIQRVASWSGAEMVTRSNNPAVKVPTPATVLTIARQLELAARSEAVAAVRRLRQEGRSWAAVATLLGFDNLPYAVQDPAALAFDYSAGLPRSPWFSRAVFAWDCHLCGQAIIDLGPGSSPADSQRGHAAGCERLLGDIGEMTTGEG